MMMRERLTRGKQEELEQPDSPPPVASRMPSPPTGVLTGVPQPGGPVPKPAFPFHSGSRNVSTAALVAQLPPENDARTLIDAYCRHFAWQYVWTLTLPTCPAGQSDAMSSDTF